MGHLRNHRLLDPPPPPLLQSRTGPLQQMARVYFNFKAFNWRASNFRIDCFFVVLRVGEPVPGIPIDRVAIDRDSRSEISLDHIASEIGNRKSEIEISRSNRNLDRIFFPPSQILLLVLTRPRPSFSCGGGLTNTPNPNLIPVSGGQHTNGHKI